MNTSMVEIVKRIVADRGEAILADPQALRALFADYAMGLPKLERAAFGRCIEIGAYSDMKRARDSEDLRVRKIALAKELTDKFGIEVAVAAGAIDVLAAAMFETPAGASLPQSPVAYQSDNSTPPPNQVPFEPPPSDASMVDIVRRIVTDKGEAILAEPRLLASAFSTYAMHAPREERAAFGKCIEIGGYKFLKRATNAADRSQCRVAIAKELSEKQGIDGVLAVAAVGVLDAVLFGGSVGKPVQGAPLINANPGPPRVQITPQPAPPQPKSTGASSIISTPRSPVSPPVQPNSKQLCPANAAPSTLALALTHGTLTWRTLVFGICGIVAALLSVYVGIRFSAPFRHLRYHFSTAIWDAWDRMATFPAVVVGASLGLLIAQSIYMNTVPKVASQFRTLAMAALFGVIAASIALVFLWATNYNYLFLRQLLFPPLIGLVGLFFSLIVASFLPNYDKSRAALTGFLPGFIAGSIPAFADESIASAVAAFVLLPLVGLSGLWISAVEELSRKAWITVILGPKSHRSIGLGAEPIVLGSGSAAHVLLPKPTSPAIKATVQFDNGQVVMHDVENGERHILQRGQRVDFGTIGIVVGVKGS